MADTLLRPIDVARRWHIHESTLNQWRWRRKGPRYVKVGNRVVYRLEDIERFEAERDGPRVEEQRPQRPRGP